ncbi:MAG: PD40 domain-containing protein [Actinobacteria bacterium]|nr:PD40 domain-containing protein [Actinomycetota bacterium]
MSADGTGLKALPRPGKFALGPNWTPDGKRIVFLQGPTNSIAMINANGTGLRNPVVRGHGGDSVCVFSDGKRVAFLRSQTPKSDGPVAIFVARLDGKTPKRITPWGGYADKIDCSPDGTRVAYSAPSFDHGASNVYTIKADGTHRVQLTHTTNKAINNGLDSWSPDGTKIAFISNVGADSYQLYSLNTADGTGVAQITSGETHLASWGSHA